VTVPRVWSPYSTTVELLLPTGREPMTRDERGWWQAAVEVPADVRYAFSVDRGDARPDPRGLRLPDGPHGWSQGFDLRQHTWTDGAWKGRPLDGAVVYEAHVGTFTPEGTLDAAASRLPYLADLGVDVVELLPLAPFPGERNWGYDGIAPWAVHEVYGGPAALQRFVDAAHGHGLAVCLDLVYNHLGPDGNYLGELGPYLNDAYVTPWGQALNLDGRDSDEVRAWVLDNVELWLRDFHVDGLRLDAVHELHDGRALTLLEEMAVRVAALSDELGREMWLVAESDRNDPRTVTPRGAGDAAGGVGLDAQWADDVHHALHVALTGETQGYYADFADPGALAKVLRTPYLHDGTLSTFRGRVHGRPAAADLPGWRFVAALQTHDQVGNRATGDRLSATLSPGLLACGAAVLLCAPWTPMLFMGEEWAASTPWQFFTDHTDPALAAAVSEGRRSEFADHGWSAADVPDPQALSTFEDSRLDWDEREREPHARVHGWYRDLLALRRAEPDLRGPRCTEADVAWSVSARTLSVRRGSCVLLANLGPEPATFDVAGEVLLAWEPVSSESGRTAVPAESAVVLRS